jgi:mitochondrial import receptor subunit TOM40
MAKFDTSSALDKESLRPPQADYLNLPQPVRYEEIQREGIMVLKPDSFEGMRFEVNKPLNPYFFL